MQRKFKRPVIYLLIINTLLLAVALLGTTVFAETSPTKLVLGTATKGGGFQVFGQSLAEVINATDPSLHVETIATRGSKQNLPFLEEGKIDIGLVEGNAARQALEGIGRLRAKLYVLAVMYPNPGMFVVLADSPYKTIEDLKGHPVAFGTRASGLRVLANDVLDGLGLKADRDFSQVILDKAADGPRLVLKKQVAALWGAGIGWPGFVKVTDTTASRFIAPSPDEIAKILSKYPHLKKMSVPAGTYHGQEKQIDSVGLWSLILVRPDLPDEVVYRLARAIHQGEKVMAKQLKQGAYTTAENTVEQIPAARLHPGAATYYRKMGFITNK